MFAQCIVRERESNRCDTDNKKPAIRDASECRRIKILQIDAAAIPINMRHLDEAANKPPGIQIDQPKSLTLLSLEFI